VRERVFLLFRNFLFAVLAWASDHFCRRVNGLMPEEKITHHCAYLMKMDAATA
jgi:hypothetical protein